MPDQDIFDFIIVGSGTSGGVVAQRLQHAGARCLLLEAGKYYRAESFPENEADYSAQLFWGGGLEFDTKCTMGFLRGKCVGGGSIVNQCLLDRFDDAALDDWKTASGVDYFTTEAMDPWYAAIEADLALMTLPEEHRNRNAHLFIQGLERAGICWAPLRRGQSDCATEHGNDCMPCLGGCRRDSKQSSLVAFIRRAEREGLTIVPEFHAAHIEHRNDGVTVRGRNGSGAASFHGRRCILAGGSFGTTQLLLASGFKDRLPALGRGFTMHPQYMTFAEFDDPVDAHKGAFQTVKSADPGLRAKGYKLENVFAPPVSVAMLFARGGSELQAFMLRYRYLACMEVAVRDEATGELSIDRKGRLRASKALTAQDRARRDEGLKTVRGIFESLGAKGIFQSPLYFGLHLMGGCAIGTDPARSVVGPDFQVHDRRNLYIADTSIYPNAPGINPALTCMALTHRLATLLARR
ncbi:MAG: GMC family oxidoreductase [Candidatus Hydrogenedentes bacterium]|nr:GMC family oxidoreductase [Candidatus Hydrogenedentota bacterium]